MAMAASASGGNMADMDCSPAELEELIKEVRRPPHPLLPPPSQRPPSRLHLPPGVFPPCHRVSALISLQKDGCDLQASPEYWSHSSISSKSSACEKPTCCGDVKLENRYNRNFTFSTPLSVKAVLITRVETGGVSVGLAGGEETLNVAVEELTNIL